MREDDPATEIANSFSECMGACHALWTRSPNIQRDAVLDAVSWFVEAAPLDELPTVWADGIVTKDMIRNGAAVAARLKAAVMAWDGMTEPPPSLLSLAREFLVAVGMERFLEAPPTEEREPKK